MTSAVIFQIQSALIVALMTWGILKRKKKSLHVKIMSSAMIWDILLILQIELTRGAVMKASNAMINETANKILLNIHVSFAISSVVFYGLMVYTGKKLLSGDNSVKSKHRVLGIITYLLRVLTLVTSFWAVTK